MWLSRRGPFVIGMFYGWMLPGYVVRGVVLGWWNGWREAVQDWRRDRDFMLRWSMAPRTTLPCVVVGQNATGTNEPSDGIDTLGADFEPLPTGDELRRHWLERLPQGERIVLEHVVAAYPESIERDEISDATGYKRSSRDTYLQKLIARKLVQAEGRGRVVASDSLFD